MDERCRIYRNFWKVYRLGLVRLLVLDLIFSYYVWKEREIAELRELCKGITQFLAFYPERRKIVLYVMRYKVILWLSVDEVGNHAV